MTTWLFPGQGSQSKGMGKDSFAAFPELVQQADQFLGYSIVELCLDDPKELLNNTAYTQPAIYVVSALAYLKKCQEEAIKPAYLAGHSLGEFSALFAAGVFDFLTGLKLVTKRGYLMSQASGGGMAAVVGVKSDAVQEILKQNSLNSISIANFNTYTQNVLTGPKEAIDAARPIFEQEKIMFVPLKVSGAFHSPFMAQAQQEFAHYLKEFQFTPPRIPVIANVDALPYQPEKIHENLIQQIAQPVLWTATMEYLLQQGETDFTEVGPGTVLTGLARRIQKGS